MEVEEEWLLTEMPILQPSAEGESPELDIRIELSQNDEADALAIEEMYGNNVIERKPCCRKKCNERIPKDIAVKHRYAFQEFSNQEKDIIILSQLQTHRRLPQLIEEYNKDAKRGQCRVKNKGNLSRLDVNYYFCDLAICKKMYLFLHDVGEKRFKNLAKHYDANGLTSRTHKSKLKPPARDSALTLDHIKDVVNFIQNFADKHVTPSPKKSLGLKKTDVRRLPSNVTKNEVYRKYSETDMKTICRSTFMNVWKKYCPFITVSKSANVVRDKVHKSKTGMSSEKEITECL